MTLIQSMNISRESLVNNQYALTIVSHNVANMNTEGYSRQRATFEEISNAYPGGSVASVIYGLGGAKISEIGSYADFSLSTAVRNANSEAQYYDELSQMLGDIETIIDQLGDDGLKSEFAAFYTAAQNLVNSPSDSSVRQTFYIAADNLCDSFNTLSNSLIKQKQDIAGDWTRTSTAASSSIGVSVDLVNQKLEQLAEINLDITKNANTVTGSLNTLKDKRDAILEELSSLIPINVREESSGAVSVKLGDIGLVSNAKCINKLQVIAGTSDDEPIILQAVNTDSGEVAASNINSYFGEGSASIGAQLAMVTTRDGFISINTIMDQIDNLANNFVATMNSIQTYSDGDIKACYIEIDADGNTVLSSSTPPNLFEGTGASNIKVTDAIKQDYNKIAAARVDTSTADWQKNVGNSTNALTIVQTRNKYVVDSSGATPAGMVPVAPDYTIEDYIISVTTDFAAQINDVNTKDEIKNSILSSAVNNRDSAIAVNLDEELADMIRYQRAYEASARVFSAASEALETLITLGR